MKKFGVRRKRLEKHRDIRIFIYFFFGKYVIYLKNLVLVVACVFISIATALAQTVIINSKSSSSSVSSFETGGYDRSSNSSSASIDSRGQSSFVFGGGSYAASSSDSFQGVKSNSYRNDAVFQTKGSSASTSSQEIGRVYGK
jgi:hypothetical protein